MEVKIFKEYESVFGWKKIDLRKKMKMFI